MKIIARTENLISSDSDSAGFNVSTNTV